MRIASQTRRWGLFSVVCALLLLTAGVSGAANGLPQAAIASAHPLATEAGFEILTAGGNAFDAAVAVSATLAVVEPYSSGLGGGFWLLHRAEDGRELMLDGRERAPLAAHRDMYLDAAGRFVPERSLNGPLAAGIPGAGGQGPLGGALRSSSPGAVTRAGDPSRPRRLCRGRTLPSPCSAAAV